MILSERFNSCRNCTISNEGRLIEDCRHKPVIQERKSTDRPLASADKWAAFGGVHLELLFGGNEGERGRTGDSNSLLGGESYLEGCDSVGVIQ